MDYKEHFYEHKSLSLKQLRLHVEVKSGYGFKENRQVLFSIKYKKLVINLIKKKIKNSHYAS